MAQLEIIIIVEGWQKQQVNVKLHLLRTILHDKCSLRDCFQLLLLLQMPQLLLKIQLEQAAHLIDKIFLTIIYVRF